MSKEEFEVCEEEAEMLHGLFDAQRLPSIKPRKMRLFVCAPFDDMSNEVEHLYQFVFPKLREFTRSRYGFEFQPVYFDWQSASKQGLSQLQMLQLCFNEIKKCEQLSIGMTFLGLVGDLSGERLPPKSMERREFEIILNCVKQTGQNTSLLETNYRLNFNHLSNKYELDENAEPKREDICELLSTGYKLAVSKKLLADNALPTLNDCALRKILKRGAFSAPVKADRVFCFVRISPTSVVSPEMHKLKDKEINFEFPAEQIYRIRTNSQDASHLNTLSAFYLTRFEKLIEKFVRDNPESKRASVVEDTLRHFDFIKSSHLSNELSSSQVMKSLSEFVFDANRTRRPLIITGPSGCGKSAYTATLASNLYIQFKANKSLNKIDTAQFGIVSRFIGIDAKTFYLRNLLKSLCEHLSFFYAKHCKNRNEQFSAVPSKLSHLKKYFKNFFSDENSLFDTFKLVVIIDALDDLDPQDHAFRLDWLPKFVARNARLILTVSSRDEQLINKLRLFYSDEVKFVWLSRIEEDQARFMLRRVLSSNEYRLEGEQVEVVWRLVRERPVLPLHFQLCAEQFLQWKSFSKVGECVLEETLESAVRLLFDRLEKRFNQRLVKHVLGYLAISSNGFSESELEDILSLDNELLKEFLSCGSIKPCGNTLRMPWQFIAPILDSLDAHLIARPFHGLDALNWRHKIFNQIVHSKYLSRSQVFVEYLHKNVAEYFLGVWGGGKSKSIRFEKVSNLKMPENNEGVWQKSTTKAFKIYADRQVSNQPIRFQDFHTHISARFNLRKLALLPRHLSSANMIQELKSQVYFSAEWMFAKISAFSFQELLYDFELYTEDDQVNIVNECLKLSEEAVSDEAKFLFSQISGRLLAFYHSCTNIKRLVDECDEFAFKLNPLVPIGQAFESPLWIRKENIDLGLKVNEEYDLELLSDDSQRRILLSKNTESPTLKLYDLDQFEHLPEIHCGKGKVYFSKNAEFLFKIVNNELKIVRVDNGVHHGTVSFDRAEVSRVYVSSNHAAILFRKAPSPLLIHLKNASTLTTFAYEADFAAFSPDSSTLLIHAANHLHYHHTAYPFRRKISLPNNEIPLRVQFASLNTRLFLLSKHTKQVSLFTVNLAKAQFVKEDLLQDAQTTDIKLNDTCLLVSASFCIYVFDSLTLKLLHKLTLNTFNLPFQIDKITGFGVFEKSIYATFYTNLVCFDAESGQVCRVFQSGVKARRILHSFEDGKSLLSVLDDGEILVWNLKCLKMRSIKFEEMRVTHGKVIECALPKIEFNHGLNSSLAVSRLFDSPDVLVHSLRDGFETKFPIMAHYKNTLDDPIEIKAKLCKLDPTATFIFVLTECENFDSKKIIEEKFFVKQVGSILTLRSNQLIEQFAFIIRKNSRFEINAHFLEINKTEIYLLIKITSCINDFDPFSPGSLDWTEFETSLKIYGPISFDSVPLLGEYKLNGECLDKNLLFAGSFFACLTQECHKLYDKKEPSLIKAKRYEINLNILDILSANKLNKIQRYSIDELLPDYLNRCEHFFLDLRCVDENKLLIIYSSEELSPDGCLFEYDYSRLEFDRNVPCKKSALIYDLAENKVSKFYEQILNRVTNVENVVFSRNGTLALDNEWNLYDLKKNCVVERKFQGTKLSFKFVNFVLEDRYLVTCAADMKRVSVVRVSDWFEVAAFLLHDNVACLTLGERDRTILIGTQTGCLLTLKLLVDLEYFDAVKNTMSFYRKGLLGRTENKKRFNEFLVGEAYRNDLKNVLNTEHSHRLLKRRETIEKSSKGTTEENSCLRQKNLSDLSYAIKYSVLEPNQSRACLIQ